MKTFTEKLAEKFGGLDKIAHFGVGGLMCALVTLFILCAFNLPSWMVIGSPVVGDVIVLVLSLIKEYKIDPEVNLKDVYAGLCGCVCVHIAVLLGALLHLLVC